MLLLERLHGELYGALCDEVLDVACDPEGLIRRSANCSQRSAERPSASREATRSLFGGKLMLRGPGLDILSLVLLCFSFESGAYGI